MKTTWLTALTIIVALMAAYLVYDRATRPQPASSPPAAVPLAATPAVTPAPAPQAVTPPAKSDLTPEQRVIAEAVLKDAVEVLRQIDEQAEIRPRTPEFLQLRLDWSRRLLDAQLRLATDRAARVAAMDAYLVAANRTLNDLIARSEIDASKASIAMVRIVIAEVELLKASAQ